MTATSDAAAGWDAAAEGWNRSAPLIRAWLNDATHAMLDAARIGPGARVLDIAAGAGDQTLDIARRVGPQGKVLATDISPRILALAQANADAAGLRQVETRVADAQQLDLDGAAFDAALCRLGLMFCLAPIDALKAARAALKPGGRFAALVFGAPQGNPCIAIMAATAMRHRALPAASPYAPGTLLSLGEPGRMARLLGAAGFVEVEVRSVSAPFHLPSAAAYIEFVRTSGSPLMQMLAPLPPDAQRAAWDDMTAQLGVFGAPDGWHGPNELLLCSAAAP
ncbi:class I SAM-dependent methyltransferase [Variovorax fucosicus]|uniref:class I SAM-dependent methyltransferase n=1 Tax=Variovorax fucosicus TaxID=3053517 RepID=UPI0025782F0F|nr:methyltransferase domain-containing protein [Variovorax sp. J22G47]MDM0055278.1 methyltransferase domain-containing protein [Variovorax sp. J22G47]